MAPAILLTGNRKTVQGGMGRDGGGGYCAEDSVTPCGLGGDPKGGAQNGYITLLYDIPETTTTTTTTHTTTTTATNTTTTATTTTTTDTFDQHVVSRLVELEALLHSGNATYASPEAVQVVADVLKTLQDSVVQNKDDADAAFGNINDQMSTQSAAIAVNTAALAAANSQLVALEPALGDINALKNVPLYTQAEVDAKIDAVKADINELQNTNYEEMKLSIQVLEARLVPQCLSADDGGSGDRHRRTDSDVVACLALLDRQGAKKDGAEGSDSDNVLYTTTETIVSVGDQKAAATNTTLLSNDAGDAGSTATGDGGTPDNAAATGMDAPSAPVAVDGGGGNSTVGIYAGTAGAVVSILIGVGVGVVITRRQQQPRDQGANGIASFENPLYGVGSGGAVARKAANPLFDDGDGGYLQVTESSADMH